MKTHYLSKVSKTGSIFSALIFVMLMMAAGYAQAQCPKPTLSGSQVVCVGDVTQYTISNWSSIPPTADVTWQVNTTYGVILNSGFTSNGIPFVSVRWNNPTTGPQAWVRASYSDPACPGGVVGDPYNVSIFPLPEVYNFFYDAGNHNYPDDDTENAYYCHGSNGVTLTLDNSQTPGFEYDLVRVHDDVTVQTVAGTGSAITFNNVVVEDDALPGSSSTEYIVVAYNPQLCQSEMLGSVTVHKFAEPTVLFEVNNVQAATGSHYEFCYDVEVEVTLSEILLGSPTMTLSWEVDGYASLNGTDVVAAEGTTLFGPSTMNPGTYTVTLTKLEDGTTGCSHTDLSIYYFTITIWEEPAIGFSFNGDLADTGDTFEYCYDEDVDITLSHIWAGDAPFTIAWSYDGPLGTVTSSGTFNQGDFLLNPTILDPGTYTIDITSIVDVNGCEVDDLTPYNATVIVHPEPAIGFSFNGDLADTGDTFPYCYDDDVSITLSHIWAGDAPFTIAWSYDGPLGTVTNSGTFNQNDYLLSPNTLDPGTYTITITSIVDANNCEVADVSPYTATVIVHPEPTLDIEVVDNQSYPSAGSIISAPYEFCWDGEFGIYVVGDVGTGPWSLEYRIEGPSSFEITGPLSGTAGVVWIDLDGNYPAGTYTFTLTSLSDDVCEATDLSIYTFNVEVLPKPVVENFTIAATLGVDPVVVNGDYNDGFEMCISGDDNDGSHLLDIVSFDLAADSPELADNQFFGFYLDSYPTTLFPWWDAKGVNASSAPGSWQAHMWDVINGDEPITYLMFDGTDYNLYDGTQRDFESLLVPMLVPSDYPEGAYVLKGFVYSDNGCISDEMTITFNFYDKPVVVDVDLTYSTDDTNFVPVTGDLDTGYELCISNLVDWYYLGVDGAVIENFIGTISKTLEIGNLNEFFLDVNNLPAGFYTWWETKGVDGTNNAQGWELAMWDIINGDDPMFFLEYDGTAYFLWDGLQGQGNTLRINGDYLAGTYTFLGTVLSDEGCTSKEFGIEITFYEGPLAVAGADAVVCNDVQYELQAVPSVGTGEWTYVGPATLTFTPDANTATATITADVAGVYTLTWTETNGICVDDDEVVITFLKGTLADAYYLDPILDIDAVSNAPVVTLFTYYLPTPDVNADPNIIMDGLIKTDNTWPTDAKVVEVRRAQAITTTWFPVVDGDLGGRDFIFLSDLIGISNPLFNNINPQYPWIITVEGFDGGTYNMEIAVVTYITKPTDLDNDCYAILDSEEYTLTFNDAVVTVPADCVETCYTADELHELAFDISIEYPAINNVDVNDEITLDALLTITDGNAFNNVQVYWGYNGPATNLSSFNFDGESSVYLSQIVGVSPTPLSGHSGTVVWSIRIVGLNPGYYELDVESLALIDLYAGTQIANNTGLGGLPQAQPGDFGTVTYTYTVEELCFNVVGSLEVSIDPITNIETITGAPVLVSFAVNYDDLSDENIDGSVMADALISFDPALPATANIEALYFLTGAVFQTVTLDYSLNGATEVLLSEIVGSTAPVPLNTHTDNSTDTWVVVLAGIDVAGTYTVTVEAIAYVGTYSPTNVDFCYSVTAEEEFTVTLEDIDVISVDDPDPVCEGDDVVDADFSLEFPAISSSQHEISFDVKVTVSSEIPAGTVVNYNISGLPPGSFTFTSAQPANTPFNLFGPDFINLPITFGDLNNATVNLEFDYLNLDPGYYMITSEPFAYIPQFGFGPYDLVTDDDIIQNAWVYPAYEPEITGDTPVYSGSTTPYSIEPQNVNELFNDESWVTTDNAAVSGLEIVFSPSNTQEEASIALACPGEVCFDWEVVTTDPNNLVYLQIVVGSNTPTVVYNGTPGGATVTGTFCEFVTGSFVFEGFASVTNDATITISNFNFEVEQSLAWSIGTVTPTTGSTTDVAFVGTYTDVYSVEVETAHPFTGQYELIVEPGNCAGCGTATSTIITVLPNTLAGQLKYYNSKESAMPSPFYANFYGTEVPDYFYVALVTDAFDVTNDWPLPGNANVIEVVQVNEIFDEDGLFAMRAAFEFEENLDPNNDYRIIVWDGGLAEWYFGLNAELGFSWTWNNWGGVNATDALLILHMAAGSQVNNFTNMDHIGNNNLTPMPYGFFAVDVADVNNAGSTVTGITALDALLTSRRSVGLIQRFPNNKPNFAVAGFMKDEADYITDAFGDVQFFQIFNDDIPNIEFVKRDRSYIFGDYAIEHNYYTEELIEFDPGSWFLNIYYNAVGDINSSYVPAYGGFKELDMQLLVNGQTGVGVGEELVVPISITKDADLGALSLGLNYNNDLIEIIGTNYGDDYAYFDHESGMLRIAFATLDGLYLEAGSEIAFITVRILDEIPAGTPLFWLTDFTELADMKANVIEGIDLTVVELTTEVVAITDPAGSDLSVQNFPNPFNSSTTISYSLPETGEVKLVVYNNMGQIVKTLVDTNQDAGAYEVNVSSNDLNGPGVYYYRLVVNGIYNQYSATNSMVLIK